MMPQLRTVLAIAAVWLASLAPGAWADGPATVYKTPSCGCCKLWVDHLRESGMQVQVHDRASVVPVKQRLGVPPRLASCHTALVDGYVIEGHVPAAEIERLLATRPEGVMGLAVPGMPRGSPGMEFGAPQPYDVLAFSRDGSTRVFASYGR